MEQIQCPACSAMVDQTKAFCPECGNPIEPEKQREESNEMSGMSQTFRLDDESFKQMLKEMKLSPEAAAEVERQTRTNLNIDLSEILGEKSPTASVPPPLIEKPLPTTAAAEKNDSKGALNTLLIVVGVLLALLILILIAGIILFVLLR